MPLFKSKNDIPTDEVSPNNVLHVYYEGSKLKGLKVLDSSKSTPLYHVDIKWHLLKMPQLTISSAASNGKIASVNYHCTSSKIELDFYNQPLKLTSPGFWDRDYKFPSPLTGSEMVWQPRKKLDELNMVLLDNHALPVARFLPSNWAMRKGGKIEILASNATDQRVQDEIVVTALAVMVYRHIQRQYAATASASSAASSAATG